MSRGEAFARTIDAFVGGARREVLEWRKRVAESPDEETAVACARVLAATQELADAYEGLAAVVRASEAAGVPERSEVPE